MGWNPFRRQRGPVQPASGPAGKRAYAIGDIHGRADLLDALLRQIAKEEESRPAADTFIVFLGDLIDRGADSAGVVDRLLTTNWGHATPIFLMGNHEEMLLRILDGDHVIVHDWLSYGGFECAQSYGAPAATMIASSDEDAVAMLVEAIPAAHVDFIRSFGDSFRFGDYLFVHAGIRPGVPLEQQSVRDLRWIRDGFLDVTRNDGVTVVHGHTIVREVSEGAGRIGIDTGAYTSGTLTALCVDGTERKFLFASESAGLDGGADSVAAIVS